MLLHSDNSTSNSEHSSTQSTTQSNDPQTNQTSLVVTGQTCQSDDDVVAHSDFSLVSQTEFNIAPGQFRMALEEANPPIVAQSTPPVGGDNDNCIHNGVSLPATVAADNVVVPNGVPQCHPVHAGNVPNGDNSTVTAHSTVPYLEKSVGMNSSQTTSDRHILPHVASILHTAGAQMGDSGLSQQEVNCPIHTSSTELVVASSSDSMPAPSFIPPPPSITHSLCKQENTSAPHKIPTNIAVRAPNRFKAQEAKEREERVRKRLAAGLPAEDPATPTAQNFLLSPSASMTSGGRPSSAVSSSMMSEGSGVFSSDISGALSRSSSMFSLDSSTGGSIGPLEPGALKVRNAVCFILYFSVSNVTTFRKVQLWQG